MAQTPEGRVKAAVKKLLTTRAAYYYMPMSNGMGRVGAPDFMICLPHAHGGKFIGVETKAPGKRNNTTANQQRELEWIRRAGGMALVVDDAEQLRQALDELEGEPHVSARKAQSAGAQAPEPG